MHDPLNSEQSSARCAAIAAIALTILYSAAAGLWAVTADTTEPPTEIALVE